MIYFEGLNYATIDTSISISNSLKYEQSNIVVILNILWFGMGFDSYADIKKKIEQKYIDVDRIIIYQQEPILNI